MKFIIFVLTTALFSSAQASREATIKKLKDFEGYYYSKPCGEFEAGAFISIKQEDKRTRYDISDIGDDGQKLGYVPGLTIKAKYLPFKVYSGEYMTHTRNYSVEAVNVPRAWWRTLFSIDENGIDYRIEDHSRDIFNRIYRLTNLEWTSSDRSSLVFKHTYAGNSRLGGLIERNFNACLFSRITEAEYNARVKAEIGNLQGGGDYQ